MSQGDASPSSPSSNPHTPTLDLESDVESVAADGLSAFLCDLMGCDTLCKAMAKLLQVLTAPKQAQQLLVKLAILVMENRPTDAPVNSVMHCLSGGVDFTKTPPLATRACGYVQLRACPELQNAGIAPDAAVLAAKMMMATFGPGPSREVKLVHKLLPQLVSLTKLVPTPENLSIETAHLIMQYLAECGMCKLVDGRYVAHTPDEVLTERFSVQDVNLPELAGKMFTIAADEPEEKEDSNNIAMDGLITLLSKRGDKGVKKEALQAFIDNSQPAAPKKKPVVPVGTLQENKAIIAKAFSMPGGLVSSEMAQLKNVMAPRTPVKSKRPVGASSSSSSSSGEPPNKKQRSE